jgi:hypothetical protein
MSLADKASSTPCTPTTFEQPSKHLSKSASSSGGIVINSKPKPTQKLDHVFEPVKLPPSVSTQISLTPPGPARSSSMSAVTNENLPMGPHSDAPAVMVSTAAPNVPRGSYYLLDLIQIVYYCNLKMYLRD